LEAGAKRRNHVFGRKGFVDWALIWGVGEFGGFALGMRMNERQEQLDLGRGEGVRGGAGRGGTTGRGRAATADEGEAAGECEQAGGECVQSVRCKTTRQTANEQRFGGHGAQETRLG